MSSRVSKLHVGYTFGPPNDAAAVVDMEVFTILALPTDAAVVLDMEVYTILSPNVGSVPGGGGGGGGARRRRPMIVVS